MKRRAISKPILFRVMLAAITAVNGLSISEASAQTRTYDVWFSASDSGPPFAAFHDCWTITFAVGSVTLESEAFDLSGPAYVPAGNFNIFAASWPVVGQTIFGWFLNGSVFGGADAIGGVMVRAPKTWAFEGIRNDACVL